MIDEIEGVYAMVEKYEKMQQIPQDKQDDYQWSKDDLKKLKMIYVNSVILNPSKYEGMTLKEMVEGIKPPLFMSFDNLSIKEIKKFEGFYRDGGTPPKELDSFINGIDDILSVSQPLSPPILPKKGKSSTRPP